MIPMCLENTVQLILEINIEKQRKDFPFMID